MPSGVADYGANYFGSVLLGVNPVQAGFWVALCADAPGAGMDGDIIADLEPAAAGYARLWLPAGPAYWGMNGDLGTNLTTLDYGVTDEAWGPLSHYALLDGELSANLYAFGEFLTPVQADAGLPIFIPAGGITIQLVQLLDSITP